MSNIEHRAIALAGLNQAVRLVRQLARDGRVGDESAYAASLGSTLRLDATDHAAVFGGLAGLRVGLKALDSMLAMRDPKGDPGLVEELRYSMALMQLERQLQRNSAMQEMLGKSLSNLGRTEVDPANLDLLANRLGELYKLTISTMSPRVLVQGEQTYLGNPQIAASIRALLLAGIRSAALWRQSGGGRIRLMLERRALQATCESLLARL